MVRPMMNAKQCRVRAATAERKAAAVADPEIKVEFLENGRLWIALAVTADAQDLLQLKLARAPTGIRRRCREDRSFGGVRRVR